MCSNYERYNLEKVTFKRNGEINQEFREIKVQVGEISSKVREIIRKTREIPVWTGEIRSEQ
ncbi:hypothetical protein AM1BK_10110 [Neobacillus kokaensis]|uniref:Uncharacterized protein n=1 Tax=Neobacillus kokaensis TaxID=2759023 RepID=A0ABQ3N0F6_9BACI|nr:hypothetical protein AM1BK_10110 [Neobacillus kokaensis]